MKHPKILLLPAETTDWKRAQWLSYNRHLSLEEGLAANDVDFVTIAAPWFPSIPDLCRDIRFDQVWVEVTCRESQIDDRTISWIKESAEVRVGFLSEPLEFLADDCEQTLEGARNSIERWLPQLTHIAACDELDASRISSELGMHTLWSPPAVPARCIRPPSEPADRRALSIGSRGLELVNWLDHPALQGIMAYAEALEVNDELVEHFNRLINLENAWTYIDQLRDIRKEHYEFWLNALQVGVAVVDLARGRKGCRRRVVDGLAAGRPVISCETVSHPRSAELFACDSEIKRFSEGDIEELANAIRLIIAAPNVAKNLVERGQEKLRRYHTVERRAQQILKWIDDGVQPSFC